MQLTMTDTHRLIYIHDPMCSWCWGFGPTLAQLCEQLPEKLGIERLLGGLAPDSDRPMPDELQLKLQDTWRRIQTRIPGTRFNFDFWRDCRPRRSTWPACRAVIAARQLDPTLELPMIEAIQRAYYLEARNPSDRDTLVALARQLGLDSNRFAERLDAADTRDQLEHEIRQAHRIGADSFPSLRLQIGDSVWPIAVDYTDAGPMLEIIQTLVDS
jgi:putative protein-disulfide isomerase